MRLYVDHLGRMFDEHGRLLEHGSEGWTRRACRWSAAASRAARTGDVRMLLDVVRREELDCAGPATTMRAREGQRLDSLLAATTAVGPAIPSFDLKPGVPAKSEAEISAEADGTEDMPVDGEGPPAPPVDFVSYLASTMTWYIEWPHIDDAFTAVYATLPGYAQP